MWTSMKHKHKKIASRAKTRRTSAYCTRSVSMTNMSLCKIGMTSLQMQKRAGSSQMLTKIVGCRFIHDWKEGNEPVTHWKAIVLDQLLTTPIVYLVKYDGIDCVYVLQHQTDESISKLKIMLFYVSFPQVTDTNLENTIVGKEVEHKFEGKSGCKEEWRAWVLAQVPMMKTWFYITYENHLVLFIYQLLDDYLDGNLRVITDSLPTEANSEVGCNALIGDFVNCKQVDRIKRIGKVIYKLPATPSIHFIQFGNDPYIYVYNMMKNNF